MAARIKEFIKLPGKRREPFGVFSADRYSLWQGKNQLLSIINHGYSENYYRLPYKNIQAIIITKTNTMQILNFVHGCFICFWLLLTLIGFSNEWHIAPLVIVMTCAAISFILLGKNSFDGPTCKTFIKTSVQTHKLGSLSRIKKAVLAIIIIREATEAVQGGFVFESSEEPIQAASSEETVVVNPQVDIPI